MKASFERKTKEAITLPDGTFLAKGSHVAAPAYSIGHDQEFFEDPENFDGLRFYRLQATENNRRPMHHYVSVSETSLGFGYGRHACPGRWFAAIEIKLFLAFLTHDYDIEAVEIGNDRPRSTIDQFFIYPDASKMVALRRRKF